MLICQVCKTEPAIGVAASSLGPFSIAYCRPCLSIGCEPLDAIEATYEMCGGKEQTKSWIHKAEKLTRMRLARLASL